MSEPFLGSIHTVGFNFAPRGYSFCDGQLLPISQYSALFSLLGTTYGGDGRTTFGLPDLRSRFPRHVGNGPGLDTVTWGEKGGNYQHHMTTNEMPSHNHAVRCHSGLATSRDPNGGYWSGDSDGDNIYHSAQNNSMNSQAIANSGGGQAFNILNPYLGVYFTIALTGIYPSRN